MKKFKIVYNDGENYQELVMEGSDYNINEEKLYIKAGGRWIATFTDWKAIIEMEE